MIKQFHLIPNEQVIMTSITYVFKISNKIDSKSIQQGMQIRIDACFLQLFLLTQGIFLLLKLLIISNLYLDARSTESIICSAFDNFPITLDTALLIMRSYRIKYLNKLILTTPFIHEYASWFRSTWWFIIIKLYRRNYDSIFNVTDKKILNHSTSFALKKVKTFN